MKAKRGEELTNLSCCLFLSPVHKEDPSRGEVGALVNFALQVRRGSSNVSETT